MRTSVLLLLLAIGLFGPPSSASGGFTQLKSYFYPFYFAKASEQSANTAEQIRAPNFQPNTLYQYIYDAQVSSGMSTADESGSPTNEADQKAATRIQSLVKVMFATDRRAQLCMTENRFGQQTEPMAPSVAQQCRAPMETFEPKEIPEEKRQKLELCCQFDYVDGVIARVQFNPEDESWSKNMKRGVLNLLQLNLRQNNAQGLESAAENEARMQAQQQMEKEEEMQAEMRDLLAHSFTVPEMSVEGACQTTYTVNSASPRYMKQTAGEGGEEKRPMIVMPRAFNVTKSINFKQCSKVTGMSTGYQTEEQQVKCAQCPMDWYKRNSQRGENNGEQQQAASAQHPCAICYPGAVKDQTLDRQTVVRAMLKCGNEQKMLAGEQQQQNQQQQQQNERQNYCQLHSSELHSSYVYKNTKTESGGPYGTAMRTEICAKLQLHLLQTAQANEPVTTQSSDKDESLLYSAQWEIDAKRFFMYGDNEFPNPKSSPFYKVPKVSQAEHALRAIVLGMSDHHRGIDTKETIQLARLVEMLQRCSYEELQKIMEYSKQMSQDPRQQQKAIQILADAFGICGTRNCVKCLSETIKNGEVSGTKAAFAISQMTGLPFPSYQIVDEVQQLCQSEQVKHQPIVKQAACYTYGALINELCQYKWGMQVGQSETGEQMAGSVQAQCSGEKYEQYKQVLVELYERAENMADKLLALTSLGNAGIESAIPQLEQIIKNRGEHSVVRMRAIDALRRLVSQQARTIQHILLPIYEENNEDPEVRICAFAMIMRTQPESSVIDQLVYTIGQDPHKRVRSFAYQTMKQVATSKNPADRQMAKHVRSALQTVKAEGHHQEWKNGKWQIPVYSTEQQEGIFLTLTTLNSARYWLPRFWSIQTDSYLKDQYSVDDLSLYLVQAYSLPMTSNYPSYEQGQKEKQISRSRRATSRRQYTPGDYMNNNNNNEEDEQQQQQYYSTNSKSLKKLYSALGIKSRHSYPAYQPSDAQNAEDSLYVLQPNTFYCLRESNVDRVCLSMEEMEGMPTAPILSELMRSNSQGKRPSMARMLAALAQLPKQIKSSFAGSLNNKEAVVVTSIGVPLGLSNSVPMLANMEGNVQVEKQTEGTASKARINVAVSAAISHVQKMRLWLPFLVSGVKSIRSIEMNAPVNMEIANKQSGIGSKQQLVMKVKMPGEKTRLFGAHSHPFVYTAEVDPNTTLVVEPRQVRTIRDSRLDRLQHQTNKVIGTKNLGTPVHVHAHYHWPAAAANLEQICKMLIATENAIHLTYQPRQGSATEAVFHMDAECFQPAKEFQPKMHDFYAEKFENAPEEEDYTPTQDQSYYTQRKENLQTFLSKYQSQPQQYLTHRLEMEAKTVGGAKEFKGRMLMQAHCDAKMQACQLKMDAQRSAMDLEQQMWTMKANADVVMPETADSLNKIENNQQQTLNNQLTAKATLEWGADGPKQQINVRVKGEQVKRSLWPQLQQSEQQQQQKKWAPSKRLNQRTAFINQFDTEAQYTGLRPATRNVFERGMELLKSKYFWNSNSIPLDRVIDDKNPANGRAYARVVIDPVTQKHANITVKTPEQIVWFRQIELPFYARPFPLHRQRAQNTQSFDQFLSLQEMKERAECTVDGRTVHTFDGREYSAPLFSKCYTVLAKDCSNIPQYAVMMKNIQTGCENCQKNLKLVTPYASVECQPTTTTNGYQNSPIECKINNQPVTEKYEAMGKLVYNNEEKSDATMNLQGVSVRFDGYKAWVKVSEEYKNKQCGLCGHYDDSTSEQNEFRMANNQIAENLPQFHRSYTIMDGEEEGGENQICTSQELDNFYAQNQQKFAYSPEMRWEQEAEEEEEKFDGNYDQQKENAYFFNRQPYNEGWEEEQQYSYDTTQQQQQSKEYTNTRAGGTKQKRMAIMPIEKIKITEMENEICFSKKPIKQCPPGTIPTGWGYGYNDNNNEEEEYGYDQQQSGQQYNPEARNINNKNNNNNNQQQQQTQKQQSHYTSKNVPFACLSRSDPETRLLLRKIRHGREHFPSEMNAYSHSITEKIREPKYCRRP